VDDGTVVVGTVVVGDVLVVGNVLVVDVVLVVLVVDVDEVVVVNDVVETGSARSGSSPPHAARVSANAAGADRQRRRGAPRRAIAKVLSSGSRTEVRPAEQKMPPFRRGRREPWTERGQIVDQASTRSVRRSSPAREAQCAQQKIPSSDSTP
jgi:hypothetical protein